MAKKTHKTDYGPISGKLKGLEKDYPGTVSTGKDIPKIERIQSGVFVFDMYTGGGVPVNRFTIFQGGESSGKSTMLLRVIGMYLANNPDMKAAYVDFEHSYDEEWASRFIDDLDRVYYIDPDSGEQGVDIIRVLAESSDIGFIGVDSIGSMVPVKEYEKMAGESTPALQAKLTNEMIRKVHLATSESKKMGKNLTTVIICQVSAKFGMLSFGEAFQSVGSKMLKMISSLTVRFNQVTTKRLGSTNASTPIKSVHKIFTEKNKTSVAKREGIYSMYLFDYKDYPAGYIDEAEDVVKYAYKAGIITREGNKWICKGKKFDNKASLINVIDDDYKLREELKDKMINTIILDEGGD